MMKQKSRLSALLMALCLAVSILTLPAAAEGESLQDLKAKLDAASAELTAAENELSSANGLIAAETAATAALEAAEEALRKAQEENNASGGDSPGDGSGTEPSGPADLSSLENAVNTAQRVFEDAKAQADTVRGKINDLEAAVAAKQTAKNEAQSAYDAAVKAAADADAEQKRNLTPGAGDLSFSVSNVDFGTLEKDTSSGVSKSFTIMNNSSTYVMYLNCSSPSGYSVSGIPNFLAPGGRADVTISLNSTATAGDYNRTLQINGYYEEGGVRGDYRTFSLSVYATVAGKGYTITVSPASKDFGKLAEGYDEKAAKAAEITVTIENTGASNVQMNGVKGSDHFVVTAVRTESETLRYGDKTDYKIVPKHGLAVGSYTDTITFQTREGATAAFKATVVVEKKVAPLTVEPAALSFGSVEEGYAAVSPQTVTLKNNTDRAIWVDQPSSYSYEISVLTQSALPAGGSTTFTIRPRTGLPANTYTGEVIVTGSGEQAKLSVQFVVTRPAGPSTFNDVAASSTFAADIAYVSQKGLMSGVGNGNFNPQAPITRGQLVTILYRLEGQPAVSGLGFSDVAAGSYCERAVKWAAATGITNGGADGLFKPNDPISREQLAAFLYRYNRHKGYFVAQLADLSSFSDAASVASYAKDAMSWANGTKLINGTSDGRLNPSGGATRGQAAAILHRYCVSIGQ